MPVTARRLLLGAMLVDTLRSGLIVPFALLFGTQLVGLSLAETGIGLSIGTGLGIAAGPIAGELVDRFGPMRVVVAANALSVAGCAGLLVVGVEVVAVAEDVGLHPPNPTLQHWSA